jgi:hypothetical protein
MLLLITIFLTRRQRQENFFKLAGVAALFAEFLAQKVSICKPIRLRYGFLMASITLKDIPVDLHAQLKQEAGANYRSLNQELLARIQRSFDLDERLTAGQVNRLIQEAVDSGPEEPLSRAKFDAARAKARAKFHAKSKAA